MNKYLDYLKTFCEISGWVLLVLGIGCLSIFAIAKPFIGIWYIGDCVMEPSLPWILIIGGMTGYVKICFERLEMPGYALCCITVDVILLLYGTIWSYYVYRVVTSDEYFPCSYNPKAGCSEKECNTTFVYLTVFYLTVQWIYIILNSCCLGVAGVFIQLFQKQIDQYRRRENMKFRLQQSLERAFHSLEQYYGAEMPQKKGQRRDLKLSA